MSKSIFKGQGQNKFCVRVFAAKSQKAEFILGHFDAHLLFNQFLDKQFKIRAKLRLELTVRLVSLLRHCGGIWDAGVQVHAKMSWLGKQIDLQSPWPAIAF